MTISEARAGLPDLLDRVLTGEEITITRHGRAVAVVVRPDTLRARRSATAFAAADELRGRLDRARTVRIDETDGLSAATADSLLADIEASRSAR